MSETGDLWRPLTPQAVEELPAQLGMFEVCDADGEVLLIGYAGGLEPFGLRSALGAVDVPGAVGFRVEFTHAYLTRWTERLMQYQRDHGRLPAANAADERHLGRLQTGGVR